MSNAADRLAEALRDLIDEAVQAAIEQHRPPPQAARVVERPTLPDEEFDRCQCKERTRDLMPVDEARRRLGGISRATFYALVKEGQLPLVKIGRRSFVHAEELDDFLRSKRYDGFGGT